MKTFFSFIFILMTSSMLAQGLMEIQFFEEGNKAFFKKTIPVFIDTTRTIKEKWVDKSQCCKKEQYFECQYGVKFKPIRRGIPTGDSLLQSPYSYDPKYNYMQHDNCSFLYNLNYEFDIDTHVYKLSEYSKVFYSLCKEIAIEDGISAEECLNRQFIKYIIGQLSRTARDSFITRLLAGVDLNLPGKVYNLSFYIYFDNAGSFKKLYLEHATLYLDSIKLKNYDLSNLGNKHKDIFFSALSIGNFTLSDDQRRYFKKDNSYEIYIDEDIKRYYNDDNFTMDRLPLRKKKTRKKDIFNYFYLREPLENKTYHSSTVKELEDEHIDSYVNIDPQSINEFFRNYQEIEVKFKSLYPRFMESLEKNLRNMPQLTPYPYTTYKNLHVKCDAENASFSPCKEEIQQKDIYGFMMHFGIRSGISSEDRGTSINGVTQVIPPKRTIEVELTGPFQ